jgi:hypothetical protein
VRLISSKFIGRTGIAGLGAGILLLLVPGPASASSVNASQKGPARPISCGHQPHLNFPTNGKHQVLSNYSFDINHNGTTTSYCSLFGHVKSGDIVTANFTFAPSSSPDDEVTLVSYAAPAANPKIQTLLDCSSDVRAADASDACTSATGPSLTVTVGTCGFQVDLVYGEPIDPNQEGDYVAQHRWVDGQQGGLKNACPTPTATPSPTGSVQGTTSTPSPSGGGGGVQGITTPGTGAGSGGLSPTGLAGSLLVGLGIAASLFASRRTKADVV